MQATGSLRTMNRSSVQLVMLAAVAATGIAFGRWVIPATDSSAPAITRSAEASATGRSTHFMDGKLAQMDARDDAHAATTARVAGPTGAEVLVDQANVAPVSPSLTAASPGTANATRSNTAEAKLAQMDASDDKYSVR